MSKLFLEERIVHIKSDRFVTFRFKIEAYPKPKEEDFVIDPKRDVTDLNLKITPFDSVTSLTGTPKSIVYSVDANFIPLNFNKSFTLIYKNPAKEEKEISFFVPHPCTDGKHE